MNKDNQITTSRNPITNEAEYKRAWQAEWNRQFALLSAKEREFVLLAPTGSTAAKLAASVEEAIE